MTTPANSTAPSPTNKNLHRINFVFAMLSFLRMTRVASGAFLPLFLLTCGVGVAQSVTTVHINEVESNGGTPGDWFELINTGAGPVNLAGWKMLDNDDTHTAYVFPAGSTIPAGGYLVVEEASFGFGLGAADSVRLFDSTGAPYETYSWTAHATTTYGRCPNGTGGLIDTSSSTKGSANDCSSPVKINEVESNLGIPGDWVEVHNPGAAPANITGFVFKDNDDTHSYVIPPGTTIPAGGYLVLEEAAFGFGLGAADSVRLFDTTGAVVDSYTWTAHAATTYGRCPNGTGGFTTTASATKGAANDCGTPLKINEVESNLGTPGDWVEIYNPGAAPANVSGFVFKDNDDTHSHVIPGGTSIPAGGYLVLEEAVFGFGLGAADSARLFDTTGALVDSYIWTAHAATTYGRCTNGTGDFTTTTASTKGAANACPGEFNFLPWPGSPDVQTVDGLNVFGGNLSGLAYEGSGPPNSGVLWAVRNGPGSLFRLIFNGTIWTPDTTNSWSAGKMLLYPGGGTASPDSEGVTFAGGNSSGGLYVAVERDNNANSVSRNSILRFDPFSVGPTLTATHEWNLTADLPVTGANLGAEAITWIPDSFLTSSGFVDASKNHAYNPAEYPNHGTGLFFVGLEANGNIYAYALDHGVGGAFTRIATITTGLTGVMDLQLDSLLSDLWAICDDSCQGHSVVLRIDATGKFAVAGAFERPASMPNLNNEGFAITSGSECVGNRRPVFWSDDSETGGHAIRSGTLSCSKVVDVTDAIVPKAFPTQSAPANSKGWNTSDVTVAWNWTDNPGGSGIDSANCTIGAQSSGEGILPLSATCRDLAGNTANASYTVNVDKTNPTITATAKKADNTAYTFGSLSNQTVTVHYTCNDSGSLIATCTADQVFSVDGAISTSGSAVDNAGRSADSGFLLVRIDKAPRGTALSANLTNAQENPPTNPTLSTGGARPASFGTATFALNSSMTSMTFSATITNIDFTGSQTPDPNDNLIAAHIHASLTVTPITNGGVVWGFFGAPFNDNNPNDVVVIPFSSGVGGTVSGKWDLAEGNNTTLAAQLPNILAGRSYINFHTTQFGGGEIRGAINIAPGFATPATIQVGTAGVAYSQELAVIGGAPPYNLAVTSGTLPAGISLSSAGVLSGTPTAVGTSTFTVALTDSASAFSNQTFSLTILPAALNFNSALRIAQIADGGNFITQFAIVNLEQVPTSFQVKFWGDNGSALSLPIQNSVPGNVAGTLAPGATAFAQTTGLSSPALQGWAEVASNGRVGVLAVFKRIIPGLPDSEATVIGTQSGGNISLPFDNTQGFVTSVAVSNTNPTQSLSVFMTFMSENGTVSTTGISLPAHGHTAFVLPTAYPSTGGARGTIRFSGSSPDIAVLGLRFSPNNSFTSVGSFQ